MMLFSLCRLCQGFGPSTRIVGSVLSVLLFVGLLAARDEEFDLDPLTLETISDADLVVYLQSSIAEDELRIDRLTDSAEDLMKLFDSISESVRSQMDGTEQADVAESDGANGSNAAPELGLIGDPASRAKLEIVLRRRQVSERQERIVQNKLRQQRMLLDLVLLGHVSEEEGVEEPEQTLSQAAEKEGVGQASTSNQSPLDLLAPALKTTRPESSRDQDSIGGIEEAESIEEVRARNEWLRRLEILSSLNHRLNVVDQLIALEESDFSLAELLQESSERGRDLVEDVIASLNRELSDDVETESDSRAEIEDEIAELQELRERIEVVGSADQQLVESLSHRLSSLTQFRNPLLDEVSDAEVSVEKARFRLALVQSPFAPHNIKRWLVSSGPKLVLILVVFTLAWLLVQGVARKFFVRIVSKSGYGSEAERMERVDTIVRVFKNGATILIIVLCLFAILPEFGVDLTVLLGGAAVISLAVAFGAQALVKDYFYGIMILLENQYRVGNVIRVNNIAGSVEDVSLRVTMLRDLDGIAHFIPHGQITSVSNLSHGWSRAVFDVAVAYKENVDEVIEVLMKLASEMRNDLDFGPYIIEDAEMLGVDKLSDSAVIIRFIMKTRPLKQFSIRREMLRRIKNRFDELGIEIPFPHRTVYNRELNEPDSSHENQAFEDDLEKR